jgi:hypothetical protein
VAPRSRPRRHRNRSIRRHTELLTSSARPRETERDEYGSRMRSPEPRTSTTPVPHAVRTGPVRRRPPPVRRCGAPGTRGRYGGCAGRCRSRQ